MKNLITRAFGIAILAVPVATLVACSSSGGKSYTDATELRSALQEASPCDTSKANEYTEDSDDEAIIHTSANCQADLSPGERSWVEILVSLDEEATGADLAAEYETNSYRLVGQNWIISPDSDDYAEGWLEEIQAEFGGDIIPPEPKETTTAAPDPAYTSCDAPLADDEMTQIHGQRKSPERVTSTPELDESYESTLFQEKQGLAKQELLEAEDAWSETEYLIGFTRVGDDLSPEHLEDVRMIVGDKNLFTNCTILTPTSVERVEPEETKKMKNIYRVTFSEPAPEAEDGKIIFKKPYIDDSDVENEYVETVPWSLDGDDWYGGDVESLLKAAHG